MADLKLKSIRIRNWMKIKEAKIDFPEKGLIVVNGRNLASDGALLSIGSGKTGLGDAISHTLLGVSGHFKTVSRYSRDKKGNTYVRLEATFLGKPLIVEMGYKCDELSKTGEALQYAYDGGTPISRGRIEQTRADLSAMLELSPLLARWTTYVDGNKLSFDELSQSDSVDLVMSALRQPPWSEYYEKSKKAVGSFKQAAAIDEATHASAITALANAKASVTAAVDALRIEKDKYSAAKARNETVITAYISKIEALNKATAEATAERLAIAKQLKDIVNAKADENHRLEIAYNDTTEEIRVLQLKSRPIIQERDVAMGEYAHKATEHRNYANSAKICPTCRRPTTTAPDPARIQELKEAANAANSVVAEIESRYAQHQQGIEALQEKLRLTRKEAEKLNARAEVTGLSDRDEELELTINNNQSAIHQYDIAITQAKSGVSDTLFKQAEATLAERKRVQKQAAEALDKAATDVVSSKQLLQALNYWNVAFSPYGISNMVLREAIAPLNREAKRVSAIMTGGTIDVSYATQRELASGSDKAQLVVNVDNKLGSSDLDGNSKGESGITNFIIAETLNTVGQISRRIGYQWLDEVVPNQDQKVCQSIYRYLREKAEKLGILIFLVDHNPSASNYAHHVIVVEKTGNIKECESKVMWEAPSKPAALLEQAKKL